MSAYERGALWAMDLMGHVATPVVPQVAAIFGEVRHDAAEQLATAMGLSDAEAVRWRFAAGRRCFVAWVDGAIAAYGWVSQGMEYIGELERPLRLRAGEAYIWDCATLPPYRRQGLYRALLGHIAIRLRGEGMQRLWIGASLGNQPSIRGFRAAGFMPVVRVISVRLGSLCCLWLAGYSATPDSLIADARRALIAPGECVWGKLAIGLVKQVAGGR